MLPVTAAHTGCRASSHRLPAARATNKDSGRPLDRATLTGIAPQSATAMTPARSSKTSLAMSAMSADATSDAVVASTRAPTKGSMPALDTILMAAGNSGKNAKFEWRSGVRAQPTWV